MYTVNFDPPLTRPISWARAPGAPGLAGGWEGVAWAHLQLGVSSTVLRGIQKRLEGPFVQTGKRAYCSGMIGLSARPVLAALVARRDSTFAPRAKEVVRAWARYLDRPDLERDLMWGTAGALLSATELEPLLPGSIGRPVVRKLHAETERAARSELRRARKGERVYLGLSHGLAGYLLALETSSAVFGTKLEPALREGILSVLFAERYEAPGEAAMWPSTVSGDPIGIHGWCHGAPGIGLACLAGYALTKRSDYRKLAKMALAAAASFRSSHYSFCCGSFGKAQVLVEGHRVLGDARYLVAAKRVFQEGCSTMRREKRPFHSFHQGTSGRLYLERRLQDTRLPLLGLGPLSVAA